MRLIKPQIQTNQTGIRFVLQNFSFLALDIFNNVFDINKRSPLDYFPYKIGILFASKQQGYNTQKLQFRIGFDT
jgi:hypothetical protein